MTDTAPLHNALNALSPQSIFAILAWSLCWLTFFCGLIQKIINSLTSKDHPISLPVLLSSCGLGLTLLWSPLPGLDYSTANYLQGLLYSPSIGLILACALSWMSHIKRINMLREKLPRLESSAIFSCLAPLALIFYPSALGLGLWDPYRLGYQIEFITLLAGLNLLLWVIANFAPHFLVNFSNTFSVDKVIWIKTLAVWLTASLLAQALSLYESPNIWDILFDPFIALWALCWCIKQLLTLIGIAWRPTG